jgi:hypothetical protein
MTSPKHDRSKARTPEDLQRRFDYGKTLSDIIALKEKLEEMLKETVDIKKHISSLNTALGDWQIGEVKFDVYGSETDIGNCLYYEDDNMAVALSPTGVYVKKTTFFGSTIKSATWLDIVNLVDN